MISTIIVLAIVIPIQNLITFNIIVLCSTLTYKLYWQIREAVKPKLKEWITSIVKTIFWVTVFYLAYILAGSLGIWGILIFSIFIAAWKIYQGKNLFNDYTSWASDRAWGRTKKDFNLMEVLSNEQNRSEQSIREDQQRATIQSENVIKESVGVVDGEQYKEESSEELSQVFDGIGEVKPRRKRSRKRTTVQPLPDDLRPRKQSLKHEVI